VQRSYGIGSDVAHSPCNDVFVLVSGLFVLSCLAAVRLYFYFSSCFLFCQGPSDHIAKGIAKVVTSVGLSIVVVVVFVVLLLTQDRHFDLACTCTRCQDDFDFFALFYLIHLPKHNQSY